MSDQAGNREQALGRVLELHHGGRTDQAEAACRRLVEANPEDEEALNLLAGLRHQAGDADEAVALMTRSVAANPEQPGALTTLGNLLRQLGRTEDAVAALRKAVDLLPDQVATHTNLGNALWAHRDLEGAMTAYGQALERQPDSAETYANMAMCLKDFGRHGDALAACDRGLELAPGMALLYNIKGTVLLAQGATADAKAAFGAAVARDGGLVDAHSNLGGACYELDQHDEAEAAYRKTLALDPGHAAAGTNLAILLRNRGDFEDALAAYDRVLARDPENWGLRIQRTLSLPVIPDSVEQIRGLRRIVKAGIADIAARAPRIPDLYRSVGQTSFYFSFHNQNDRELQETLADLYLRCCPDLGWTAPHCRGTEARPAAGRLRVGFVSAFLREHSIGKLFAGVIEQLAREHFEVCVIRPVGKRDAVSEAIDSTADRVVTIPRELEAARRAIAGLELDILFYPDIGMNPLSYFLAFARLAPVQATSWGHPVTTGIANVDYFVSGAGIEPEDASEHYTERLIRLAVEPVFYRRPELPEGPARRRDFGLPASARLYLCPQTLFKLHPDFDALLGQILARDEKGLLVLIQGKHDRWEHLLKARLARSIPEQADRVIFVENVPLDRYLGLLSLADAILDPICFGGGVTSYEAFAIGAPVVTLPGRFMRGRITAALYRQMGIEDAIAEDEESYVEIALRMANDVAWREDLKSRIAERSDVLFENRTAVTELERFFLMAHQAVENGEPGISWPPEEQA